MDDAQPGHEDRESCQSGSGQEDGMKESVPLQETKVMKKGGPSEEGGVIEVRFKKKLCLIISKKTNISVFWNDSVMSCRRYWSGQGEKFDLKCHE